MVTAIILNKKYGSSYKTVDYKLTIKDISYIVFFIK